MKNGQEWLQIELQTFFEAWKTVIVLFVIIIMAHRRIPDHLNMFAADKHGTLRFPNIIYNSFYLRKR